MMTRRITLTIAAAILGLILIGVLVFAATGDGATTSDAGSAPAAGVSDHTTFLSES